MKKLVPVLMILLAAVTIAAVYIWQELRDVRAQTNEVTQHITELQSARLAAAAAPAPPPLPASAGLPPAAGAAQGPAPAAPAAGTPAAAKKPGNALQDLAQQMLGTPEGQEMMKAQLRMTLPLRYPDLGKELGLTPAETEKLFDILAKQQMASTSVGLDTLSGNGTRDPAAIQELQRKVQEAQRSGQAELASMLGDKMPKYQEYERTLPLRRQVNQLQNSLGTGNNALSDVQARPLITALAAEQSRIQQERRTAPRPQQLPQQGTANPQALMEQQMAQQIARTAEDNRRMINVATSYLNPQQLDGYRKMLEQQQNLETTMMRSIGSQFAPQNGGAQPAAPARP